MKRLFEKFLPSVQFYHSLKYNIVEDGIPKEPELDILGIGKDTLYIIEVKAGELNKKPPIVLVCNEDFREQRFQRY